ncbi:MAG: ATP-binding protein [Deltaproteobacteria bacterium]
MILLELAAQGIEGLPASGRWSFRPGLNAVVGAPAPGLIKALLALFFPETESLSGGGGARAGATFLADDGVTYRLVGAVGGEIGLSRLDPATSRFVPVAVPGGLAKSLQALGLPERRHFEPILLFTGPVAPPAAPSAALQAPPAGARIENKLSELTQGLEKPRPKGIREVRQRLAEVEAELRGAEEIERQQFQIDGIQQRLFQSEDALKEVERLSQERAALEGELEKLPPLTEELVEQVKKLPQLIQRRDELVKRIAEEREALGELGMGGAPLASLASDRGFVGGVLVGAGGIALAIAGSGFSPSMRWAALLDVPGFGYAVLLACLRLSAARRSQGAERKLAMLAEREARGQRAFEVEAKGAQALMKSLGADGVGELEERLAARTALLERRDAVRHRCETLESDPATQTAMASRDSLRAQLAELEAKLAQSGYRRDGGEIRHELEELRAELGRLGGSMASDLSLSIDGPPPPDPVAALFREAGELFGMTPAMLLQTVRDRAGQFVAALTERRWGAPSFAPDGGVSLARSGADPIPFGQLPELDQRLAMWAIRLVLAERLLSNKKLFLIVDEPSSGLDEARLQLVSRMSQALGRHAQVLWLGSTALPLADHTVQVA